MGLFVAVEGIDGSGKTTVISLLAKRVPNAYVTREPSEGPIGKLIKGWALKAGTASPYVDALLFAADRIEHYFAEIKPALERGLVVLTERYVESSIAYQGAAGVDVKFLELINFQVPKPDLTVILDIAPEVALARIRARGLAEEKYERLDFLKRVRELYLRRAEERGYAVINAERPAEDVAEEVYRLIQRLSPRQL
ncbi:MAG: dTMP kinase [Thermoproteus sp. AZ2]|jgi:dTMP kinase|uniref:dTMP kinase n=1 Tax=Thermoproteus sp. AZ2 TaxID=1609232 RepID=A0ACC6UYW7_9CREN